MPALSIINGVCNEKIHKLVEQSAFLEGLLTCSLKEYRNGTIDKQSPHILLFLDIDGARTLSKDLLKILLINFPIVLIYRERENLTKILKRKELLLEYMPADFSHRTFQEVVLRNVEKRLWENRTMVFGNLEIERAYREVRLGSEPLEIKGFSYTILLLLAEHMGEVVSREAISRNLPTRKRSSLRNIDTHIKQIRQNKGMEGIIRCVRPIGYCLAPDTLYQSSQNGCV